jgi:hypothetical protein
VAARSGVLALIDALPGSLPGGQIGRSSQGRAGLTGRPPACEVGGMPQTKASTGSIMRKLRRFCAHYAVQERESAPKSVRNGYIRTLSSNCNR